MPIKYPKFEDANKTRKLVTKTAYNPRSGAWYWLLKLKPSENAGLNTENITEIARCQQNQKLGTKTVNKSRSGARDWLLQF